MSDGGAPGAPARRARGAALLDGDDPFGTAGLRQAVLAAWAAMPSRFREDANAEELLSIGYRGRVIAELAANGADAARAAGVPGEIAIGIRDRSGASGAGARLWVANTGAPLDAAGVAALASLRASAKRDAETVGHFGVGFTAVRALTDEPLIVSVTGAVRFSVAGTRTAVEGLASDGLIGEMRRRGDQLPALRLPWPAATGADAVAGLPAGYVTCVWLPLRDGVDADALAASLTPEMAADLLWALPDLVTVRVPGYRVDRGPSTGSGTEPGTAPAVESGIERITVTASASGVRQRGGAPRRTREGGSERKARADDHRVLRRAGVIPADLLAGRPVEERRRTGWRLAWIVPLDGDGHPAAMTASVVGAPTPTSEPIGLPARLVVTVPVDESRGRVAGGPLTDFLVGAAADAYAELMRGAPADDRPALLPPVSFPLGEFDAALRNAVVAALQRTEFLCGAGGLLVRPGDAVLAPPLRGAAAACAADAIPGLLAWPELPATVERLRPLGVRTLPVSAVTEALAQLDRPVSFWHAVYDGLADVPADELADLPVPRSGGGTVVGPRGVLLPSDADPWALRAARLLPGLRLAAAGADHPLLRRLGAVRADAAAVLADPSVAREIRRRLDDLDAGLSAVEDPTDAAEFARLMLDLVRAAGAAAGPERGGAPLADVLLTDTEGELWPAGALLLPDAPLGSVLAEDAEPPVVAPGWVAEYGAELLQRLGLRSGFGLTRFTLPPGPQVDLPDVDAWWAAVNRRSGAGRGMSGIDAARDGDAGDGPDDAVAVTDLDLVDAAAWPRALTMIAARRETRDCLRRSAFGPSYTSWWLARGAVVDGVPLRHWRSRDAADLAGLYHEFPLDLPADVALDLGVLQGLADAAAEPAELLRRWADPARGVPPWRAAALTAALVDALAEAVADPEGGGAPELPDSVRTLTGAVVDADLAAVADGPAALQVLDPAKLVAGGRDPLRAADMLDLPLASEEYRFEVAGRRGGAAVPLRDVPGAVRCLGVAGVDLAGRMVRVLPELAVRPRDAQTRAALRPDLAVAGSPRAGIRAAIRVSWWVADDEVLVDASPAGVGRAVAFLAGRWTDRQRLVAAAGGTAGELAETALD